MTKTYWRDLKVWEKSHKIVLNIYKATAPFPSEEIYGLTSQIRRAAVSVPANIVEGSARSTTKDFVRFLHNSRGSLEELRYHLLLSKDLEFLSPETYEKMEADCREVSAMLNSLITKLEAKAS
ncbi:four helix bundle protein [Planctomycetota bacterium]